MANFYATSLNATPTYGERFGKTLFTLAIRAIPLGLLIAAMMVYVMPKKYESRAICQPNPYPRIGTAFGEDRLPSQMTPHFFATQFEIIRSQATMAMVSKKLNLPYRWNTSDEDTIKLLQSIVNAQNIRGTDLIEINVKHNCAEDARDIAREVHKAYETQREQAIEVIDKKYLEDLEKAIVDQSSNIEKLTQVIARKEPLPQHPAITNPEVREQMKKDLDQLTQAKNDDERLLLASTMLVGENPVKAIHQEYLKAYEELGVLRQKQVAENDPAIAAKEKSIQILSEKMYTTLSDYIKKLQSVLAYVGRVESIDTNYGVRKQEWESYKDELKQEQLKLDEMIQKLATEQINLKQPRGLVTLHEEPVLARVPSSPKTSFILLLGGVGLPVAVLLLGFPLSGIIHLASRR